MTNNEILQKYLDNRLLLTCLECQTVKGDRRYFDDFFQDLCLTILEYDNEKLNQIDAENHMNAFVTRVIQNNIYSKTSPYYKQYRKFEERSQEISNKELSIADD